jgi:hypothetical protein
MSVLTASETKSMNFNAVLRFPKALSHRRLQSVLTVISPAEDDAGA